MNIGKDVCFRIIVLSWYVPRSEIAWSYGNSIFSFLRNLQTVLHSAYTNFKCFLRCSLMGLWENFFGVYIRSWTAESWREFILNLTKCAKFHLVNTSDSNVDGDSGLATRNPEFSEGQEVVSHLRWAPTLRDPLGTVGKLL